MQGNKYAAVFFDKQTNQSIIANRADLFIKIQDGKAFFMDDKGIAEGIEINKYTFYAPEDEALRGMLDMTTDAGKSAYRDILREQLQAKRARDEAAAIEHRERLAREAARAEEYAEIERISRERAEREAQAREREAAIRAANEAKEAAARGLRLAAEVRANAARRAAVSRDGEEAQRRYAELEVAQRAASRAAELARAEQVVKNAAARKEAIEAEHVAEVADNAGILRAPAAAVAAAAAAERNAVARSIAARERAVAAGAIEREGFLSPVGKFYKGGEVQQGYAYKFYNKSNSFIVAGIYTGVDKSTIFINTVDGRIGIPKEDLKIIYTGLQAGKKYKIILPQVSTTAIFTNYSKDGLWLLFSNPAGTRQVRYDPSIVKIYESTPLALCPKCKSMIYGEHKPEDTAECPVCINSGEIVDISEHTFHELGGSRRSRPRLRPRLRKTRRKTKRHAK